VRIVSLCFDWSEKQIQVRKQKTKLKGEWKMVSQHSLWFKWGVQEDGSTWLMNVAINEYRLNEGSQPLEYPVKSDGDE
jgi:hypothetical protein